jgi:hypothetical protein
VETGAEAVHDFLGPAWRFADPNGPRNQRIFAAQGALPLPPPQLAGVVYALTFDPDPEVRETAARTFDALPERVVDPVLESDVPPPLLHRMAERFRDDETRLIKIAVNGETDDETVCLLATLPHGKLVDAIAENQVRILRCPELVDALGENPLTGQATIDRILEFLGLQRGEALEVTGRAAEYGAEEGQQAQGAQPAMPYDPDDTTGLPQEALSESPSDEGAESSEEERLNLRTVIQNLTVVERVKLARFGNSEARSLLVRDRNRIVASAAIRSPKITENEIVLFAKARNVTEEVIRIISNNREWTRNYQVQLGLATNPRTSVPVALKFLNYLSDRDLKTIMRSRDVPAPVSQQARRVLSRKGKV